jgi:hypothetical protein
MKPDPEKNGAATIVDLPVAGAAEGNKLLCKLQRPFAALVLGRAR